VTAPAAPKQSTAPPATVPAPRKPELDSAWSRPRYLVRPEGLRHQHLEHCYWDVLEGRWVCG
jgi:hypothetical protein